MVDWNLNLSREIIFYNEIVPLKIKNDVAQRC